MSATLTGPALPLFATATPTAPGRPAEAGGRPTTLEERLTRAWHELTQTGAAECPICHTAMRTRRGSGHCTNCGTTLS